MGKRVGKLPEEIKLLHTEVEWQDIKDFRNLLVHEYFGIDANLVWEIIKNDMPVLKGKISKIISTIN